jgi:hypothetical protein
MLALPKADRLHSTTRRLSPRRNWTPEADRQECPIAAVQAAVYRLAMRSLDSYPRWISAAFGAAFLCAAVLANTSNHTVIGLGCLVIGIGLIVPRRKLPPA